MESPPSASWRSGRTAALPYPPLLAYLRYHMSIMGFKSFAKIFQFKFRFMFFKVNSAPKPEFTLQIEVFVEKLGSVRYFFCQITSVYMKTL